MARMAPGWIAILNTAHSSALNPNSSVARIRWPVEETGRYSVTPSTMPRMMTRKRIGTARGLGLVDRGDVHAAPREAVAAVHAEPFRRDRSERRRANSEGFETGRSLGRDIVVLEHEPLVARQRRARKEAEPGQECGRGPRNLDELRFTVRRLEDFEGQLAHGEHLGPADLVGLAAVTGIDCGGPHCLR